MPRLFTGLEVPRDVAFALSLKRGGLMGARWIDAENYHITLRFIGDIDHTMADDVADTLDHLSRSEPFTVRLDHLDSFGGDRPRALFAAVEPNPALVRLQAAQERLLQRVGLAPEGRKFTPHVTLARLKGSTSIDVARYLAEAGHFTPLTFTVGRFVLFSSRESLGGGPYVVESAYPLAA
jgi:2'-5' RNA ligase